MAHAFCLQPLTTLQGASSNTTFTQSESGYVDLAGYQDVTVFLQLINISGNFVFNFQTSPTKDDSLFTTMSQQVVGTPGVTTYPILYATGTPPLARYVRYQWLAPFGLAWFVTLGILLSANPSGVKLRRSMPLPALGPFRAGRSGMDAARLEAALRPAQVLPGAAVMHPMNASAAMRGRTPLMR